CFSGLLSAQAPVGNISGTVRDPSGAVIGGAQVTATSAGTAATRITTTNDEGYFLLSTLQTGEDKLQARPAGFADATLERGVVEVGQTARVQIALALGATTTEIQVGTEAIAVDTERSTLGGVINTRQIDQLPLNGRNYLELARLQPGVEIQEGRAFDPTKSRYTGVSIGSRSGREARITIDGVDAVDEHVGTTTLNISQDSIQEFQLSTSGADSSTGLSGTGGVSVITRSGTNGLHGAAFAFGRGSSFAARPGLGPLNRDSDRAQCGFNVGGPFRKDRLFWFTNFEQTRENSSVSISTPYFPDLTSVAAPFSERSSTVRLDARLPHDTGGFLR